MGLAGLYSVFRQTTSNSTSTGTLPAASPLVVNLLCNATPHSAQEAVKSERSEVFTAGCRVVLCCDRISTF
jgi:hypothetical protein